MAPARLLAPVPDLCGLPRRRRPWGLHARPRTKASDPDGAVFRGGARPARWEARQVLPGRRRIPRAREPAHGREEPAVGRRMAGECRLCGSSRPRSLEHPFDDRRGRNSDRNRALLVRVAAHRRTAARERRARAGRVLVHRGWTDGLLRRVRRERDRHRPAGSRRLGVPGREGEHGRLVPRPGRHGCRGDGDRLLVLRGDRLPDRLPGSARARAEAERSSLEVPCNGRRGAHDRNGAGRNPGPASERGLAVPSGPRGRVDRPDRARARQPRDRADDARRGCPLLLRTTARRESAVATRGQRLLLRPPRRLSRLLRIGDVPGIPRRISRRRPRPLARAGGGGDGDSSVPADGRRNRHARRLLAAARARCAGISKRTSPGSRVCSRGLRGARAVGTLQGPIQAFPGRSRPARPRRRRRRGDREPSRAVEHARRAARDADRAHARTVGTARWCPGGVG